MTTSPRQANRILEEGQALALTSINKVTNRLELFANLVVVTDMTTTAEPGVPANGDAYIGTGVLTGTDWAGFTAGNILYYSDGWYEVVALEGMYVHDNDTNDLYYYNGAAWVALTSVVGHLPLAGGTMTGAIVMGANDITGIGDLILTAAATTPCRLLFDDSTRDDTAQQFDLNINISEFANDMTFDFVSVNTARTYTFPNATGTVALEKMTPVMFRAAMADLPDTNPAAWNTLEAATNELYWLVLDFDDTTDQFAYFVGRCPDNYKNGDLSLDISWMNSGTTANNIIWNAAFWVPTDGEALNTAAFAAVQAVTDTDTTTAYGKRSCTIALTRAQADTLTAGGLFVIRLSRDADNGSDTLSGHGKFIEMTLTED